MYVSWQTIITAGAVVSALGLLLGIILKIYKWYLEQKEHKREIASLKEHHEADVQRIKD